MIPEIRQLEEMIELMDQHAEFSYQPSFVRKFMGTCNAYYGHTHDRHNYEYYLGKLIEIRVSNRDSQDFSDPLWYEDEEVEL